MPIRAETEIGAEARQTLVLVGDTRRTAALGLRSSDFALEEVRIRAFPGALAILGDDARPDGVSLSGTLWAVETFAERFLGVAEEVQGRRRRQAQRAGVQVQGDRWQGRGPLAPQLGGEDLAEVRLVVDDQHLGHHGGSFSQEPAAQRLSSRDWGNNEQPVRKRERSL